jgi:hypothetical protein
MYLKPVTTCVLTVALMQCSSKQDKKLLQEASAIHNAMVAEAEELEKKLEALAGDSTLAVPADSLARWQADFERWEAEVVEVPGNEDHHHHEEGEHHHHDHQTLDVTPVQMIVVQKELNARLQALKTRVGAIK